MSATWICWQRPELLYPEIEVIKIDVLFFKNKIHCTYLWLFLGHSLGECIRISPVSCCCFMASVTGSCSMVQQDLVSSVVAKTKQIRGTFNPDVLDVYGEVFALGTFKPTQIARSISLISENVNFLAVSCLVFAPQPKVQH